MKRFLSVFILIVSVLIFLWISIPKTELYPPVTWSYIYKDKSGKILRFRTSDDGYYRVFTPIDKISPYLKEAVLLYEDRFFQYHPGFNPMAIARGFFYSYIVKKRKMGGSTITMQLARMRFHLDSSRLKGKIMQILRAVQLEKFYSKSEILEAYLNLAPYGGNIEGAGSASIIYFHKEASRLNLSEALALAVMPQNPSKRSPLFKGGEDALEEARMRLSSIWNSRKRKKEKKGLKLNYFTKKDIPFEAPHFVDYLTKLDPWPGNKNILTTLDLDIQHMMEKKVKDYVSLKKELGIENASAILLNYQTMKVEAFVGSADYFNPKISGQVNGCDAKRSPGSTLKPFLYGLAIDQGLIHPHTLLKDLPADYSGFSPENYDKKFEGPIFAEDALIRSRNIPAVRLAAKIKNPDLYDFLGESGVKDLRSKGYYGLSLVLGGGDISMLELCRLYSILGNLGKLRNIHLLENENGKAQEKMVLSSEASFITIDMLKKNPPADEFFKKGRAAWKTGTSYGFKDAWAAGLFGKYVLVVWVGNFSGEGNPSFIGRRAAGPLFFSILNGLETIVSNTGSLPEMNRSLNIKEIDVCALSGDLPGKYTQSTIKTLFIPGKSPIRVSTLHHKVLIDNRTGLRSCFSSPSKSHEKVFEFWPSDMKKLFEGAGIYKEEPPPYIKECENRVFTETGIYPEINSPSSGMQYMIHEKGRIPFRASAETGVKDLYWFVDSSFAGKSSPDQVFLWKADQGKFVVSVVDDMGRSDSMTLETSYIK